MHQKHLPLHKTYGVGSIFFSFLRTRAMFLSGYSSSRPFGAYVLDGIHLHVTAGWYRYLATFTQTIASLSSSSAKKALISGATTCSYPDAWLQESMYYVQFDFVMVKYAGFTQCYANQFNAWNTWASTSGNSEVKVGASIHESNNFFQVLLGFEGTQPYSTIESYVDALFSLSNWGGVWSYDWADNKATGNLDRVASYLKRKAQ